MKNSEDSSESELIKLDGRYQIPFEIWNRLFDHQQSCVRWLWELHQHGCGGIVGDEMGLGKTIQIVAFLAGLSCSKLDDFRDIFNTLGPVLIVCPTTIMHQWVAEIHKWWSKFRVGVLHSSGSYSGKKSNLIRAITKCSGILITSYTNVTLYLSELLKYEWHYVILDEGHRIKNPDAQVTLSCKAFRTPHRLILTGSPIQNNLRELWSLFDFVYPGKLGTLPVFLEQFSIPITQGGYANATQVQVEIAYKCASVLRDTIKPYLLRRMKDDVKNNVSLPLKNEQVLFCKLTSQQRDLYKEYLDSPVVKDILKGVVQIFVGLVHLRKICNHPDIIKRLTDESLADDEKYGHYKRSGKMVVVESLLSSWHKQNHKVLLFTQSRKMLQILESFVQKRQYTYLKMDGTTAIGSRQELIKSFNENPDIFIFLLTTRVGGIGVNLTGANRVIIYDPDWNPSTDLQARERAWRIGQDKNVTIYRLLTAGTIEEKIYQRQIFKQYLTNRVLKDPKQRRFFKTRDLHELFTLGADSAETESSAIFAGTNSEIKIQDQKEKKKSKSHVSKSSSEITVQLSEEKIKEMREKAQQISKMIAEKFKQKEAKGSSTVEKNQEKSNEEKTQGVEDENPKKAEEENQEKSTEALSSNERKRKRKSKEKGIYFEGKRIKYLVKQSDYSESEAQAFDKQQDEYVLKKLFNKAKVHSALQHDVIEVSDTPDYLIVEREAEAVANEAIKQLRKSRESCFGAQSGIPTWTGQNGSYRGISSRFGQKSSTVVSCGSSSSSSSSDLLSSIKNRNKIGCTDKSMDVSSNSESSGFDLLGDIRNFIAFQSRKNGEATTEEILNRFKDKLPVNQTAVFKALLNKICDFHREDKIGVWQLKPEFS